MRPVIKQQQLRLVRFPNKPAVSNRFGLGRILL